MGWFTEGWITVTLGGLDLWGFSSSTLELLVDDGELLLLFAKGDRERDRDRTRRGGEGERPWWWGWWTARGACGDSGGERDRRPLPFRHSSELLSGLRTSASGCTTGDKRSCVTSCWSSSLVCPFSARWCLGVDVRSGSCVSRPLLLLVSSRRCGGTLPGRLSRSVSSRPVKHRKNTRLKHM